MLTFVLRRCVLNRARFKMCSSSLPQPRPSDSQLRHSGSIAVPAEGHWSDRASPEAGDSASERFLAFPVWTTARNTGSTVIDPSLIADLVLLYDIFHGRVNLPTNDFFETPANPNLGGHRFKLRHHLPDLARRNFAFPVRIVEPWNKLPPEAADSD